MCDTFIKFNHSETNHSFFAKNSDRDPGESQIIEFILDAKEDFKSDFLINKLKKYTESSLINLKTIFDSFKHPYSALISRPVWIWGAEMGVNEFGLAIGNEAIFSKEPLTKNGLLGMDILRLALHNTKTAAEASDFICMLIEKYGQSGNGSYSGNLKYHNSFLIKDFNEAIVIETSGKRWIKNRNTSSCSISNSYSLNGDDFISDEKSKHLNFKKNFESRFYSFFSKGDYRQKYTNEAASKIDTVQDVFTILRSHIHNKEKITWGMKSVCVHPGTLVKSETTMSMVVEYIDDKFIVWHTSSPNPCVSLFKPIIIANNNCFSLFKNKLDSLNYYKENKKISGFFVKNYDFFKQKIETSRNILEENFIMSLNKIFLTGSDEEINNTIATCYKKEEEYKLLNPHI